MARVSLLKKVTRTDTKNKNNEKTVEIIYLQHNKLFVVT